MDIGGPETGVYVRETLLNAVDVFLLFHHAAANRDKHVTVLLLLRFISTEIAEKTDIGIFPDRTCVKDKKVRRLIFRSLDETDALKDALDFFAVGFI